MEHSDGSKAGADQVWYGYLLAESRSGYSISGLAADFSDADDRQHALVLTRIAWYWGPEDGSGVRSNPVEGPDI